MSVLALYRRFTRWPGGHWLFARAVCWRAPYFASIGPRISVLEPGRCEASITHRWVGTVGYSEDGLPVVGERNGVYVAGGYSGHGNVLGYLAGQQLADLIAG